MNRASIIGIVRHRLAVDGEGVTTLVAFHGCPLRCAYCLNPTSIQTDGARKRYSCEQLYEEVRCDELYFLATGGGVTFGGGEPMMRSDFIRHFRELCGIAWRITVETSLNVPQKHLEALVDVVDEYIVDIKDASSDIYRRYTEADNRRVFSNLRYLAAQGKADRIVVRTPLIPSFNTEQDIDRSTQCFTDMGFSRFDRFSYIKTNKTVTV